MFIMARFEKQLPLRRAFEIWMGQLNTDCLWIGIEPNLTEIIINEIFLECTEYWT